jgi:hypothetical protein
VFETLNWLKRSEKNRRRMAHATITTSIESKNTTAGTTFVDISHMLYGDTTASKKEEKDPDEQSSLCIELPQT